MRKYFEIFKYSIKTKINFIFDYLMSLCSFSIHVFVFSELWDYILQGKENVAGYTKTELIWYIIIGEFILYTCNRTYKFIAEQVKSGQIANMLIKPVDFIKYMIADDLSVIVKGVINAICGITLGLNFCRTNQYDTSWINFYWNIYYNSGIYGDIYSINNWSISFLYRRK